MFGTAQGVSRRTVLRENMDDLRCVRSRHPSNATDTDESRDLFDRVKNPGKKSQCKTTCLSTDNASELLNFVFFPAKVLHQ
ncbi:hypothetical protein [Caballeronia arvi]|uniref:hypothetical protein n=1 Tax=Caballeronia arvi TaxID=1777135 RepID=UPI000772BF55|nr:hypothetical protein [Caballeronia arvi]